MTKPKRTPVLSDADAARILGLPVPKPAGYEHMLSDYRVVISDSGCGEPIAWGWHIVQTLGETAFKLLQRDYDVQCLKKGVWVVVSKWLTVDEATQKYGPCTGVTRGPRGGFKTISYGQKTFKSSRMKFHVGK